MESSPSMVKILPKLNASELRRNIGYVIQQIGLFPHYTIEKNIAIVPELKGWDKRKNSRTSERTFKDGWP